MFFRDEKIQKLFIFPFLYYNQARRMIAPFLIAGIIVGLSMILCTYRAVLGPGTFNRIVAANVIGAKAIVLLILVGYIIERPHFIDIAFLYAILNFVGILLMAKYLERGDLCSR